MPPRYPLPWQIATPFIWDVMRDNSRSFQADACNCVSLLSPPLKIINPERIPASGPALLVSNHYSRSGFQAWWIALGISAAVPMEVHWLMTNTWSYLGPLAPLSHWALTRVAQVYGFTSSPPMPPLPKDVEARARAVRRLLEIVRSPGATIALVPEGRDHPGGVLGPSPHGAGRLVEKLAIHCQRIVPIGVYEDDESLCLSFGLSFGLNPLQQTSAERRDQKVGQ
jgi:1-acyl-sn-glycerol-3-phosphate acyltransferase